MYNKQQKEIFDRIFLNKGNIKRIIECKNKEEINDIFKGTGIELTDDLFKDMKKSFSEIAEKCKNMSREELNKIVCGCKQMGEEELNEAVCKYQKMDETDLDSVVGGFGDGAQAGAALGAMLIAPWALLGGGFAGATVGNSSSPKDGMIKRALKTYGTMLGVGGGILALGAGAGAVVGCTLEAIYDTVN